MVYIDYKKAEGWRWSVKCRNINQVRHVLYDMYGNHIERCMKLSELINRKEGLSEGLIETMQKREIISDDMVSPFVYGLGVRTKREPNRQWRLSISNRRRTKADSLMEAVI